MVEQILSNLSSPDWWIGVVMVGVIISLCAAYLKPLLDKVFSSMSSYWRMRVEKKEQQLKPEIEHLSNSENARIMAGFDEMRHRIRSTQNLIFGVIALIFSFIAFEGRGGGGATERIFINALFSVFLFIGILEHHFAVKIKQKIKYAEGICNNSPNKANPADAKKRRG